MDLDLSKIPFLKRLAIHIQEESGPLLIVLPNKRSQFVLSSELSLKPDDDRVQLKTADQLMEELSGFDLIEPDEALVSFYAAYRGVESRPQPFEEFSKWAQTFLADVNELDLHLGDIQTIYQQISEYRSVDIGDIGPFEAQFRSFWSKLPAYYGALRQKLESIQLAYRGLVYRKVAEMCTDNSDVLVSAFAHRKTLWVGIVPGNPSESRLIEWVRQNAAIDVFMDVDAYYTDDPIQEAGRLFRQGNVPSENRWKVDLIAKSQAEVHIHPVSGFTSQMLRVSEMLDAIDSAEYSSTVIVLADPKLLKPALNILDSEHLNLNVTINPSLGSTGIHQFIMSLLQLHAGAEQNGDSVRFHQKSIERILTSRLARRWLDGDAIWNRLRPKIVKRNWKFVHQSWLQDELGKDMFSEQAYHHLFDWELEVPFAFDRIIQILDSWNDKKTQMKLDRVDRQALSSYSKKINQLAVQYQEVLDQSNLKSLRSFLHRHISFGRFPIQETRNEGVQLMSMLDTRLLDFKHVIIVGASDENLPGNPILATHIPFVHRLHLKLPTTRDSTALVAYHYYRLIQRATHIHFVYNSSTEGLSSGEPSRFILQMEHALAHVNPQIKWFNKNVPIKIDASLNQPLEIEKTEAVLQDVAKKLQAKLSPSAMNMYLNSPLEFYYYYVLRVPEAGDVEEEMKPSTFGTAVHNVLQSIYEAYRGSLVDIHGLEESLKRVDRLTEQEFLKSFDREDISRGRNYIQVELAKTYAKRFIQFDVRDMKKHGPVRILALEDRLEDWVEVNGMNVRLFGFADRIDERDGVTRIIDYKTGVVEQRELKCELQATFEDSAFGKALQLSFYKWAYAKRHSIPSENITSCIYSFKRSGNGYMNLDLTSEESAFIEQFENFLKNLITEILDPTVPFAHRNESKYVTF